MTPMHRHEFRRVMGMRVSLAWWYLMVVPALSSLGFVGGATLAVREPPAPSYSMQEVLDAKRQTKERYEHAWVISGLSPQAKARVVESFRRTFDMAERFRREAE